MFKLKHKFAVCSRIGSVPEKSGKVVYKDAAVRLTRTEREGEREIKKRKQDAR
jgi:hypothetical protein